MADTGKRGAGALALRLNPAGYAVAGVSIRSSSQVQFPGQLAAVTTADRVLAFMSLLWACGIEGTPGE